MFWGPVIPSSRDMTKLPLWNDHWSSWPSGCNFETATLQHPRVNGLETRFPLEDPKNNFKHNPPKMICSCRNLLNFHVSLVSMYMYIYDSHNRTSCPFKRKSAWQGSHVWWLLDHHQRCVSRDPRWNTHHPASWHWTLKFINWAMKKGPLVAWGFCRRLYYPVIWGL